MGIAFSYVRRMEELGLLRGSDLNVLDIGSSNLYSATSDEIKGFLRKYGALKPDGMDAFAERLSYGSGYDPIKGGRNEAFIGELFEAAGMHYESFDIAAGYRTTVLDLNHAVLPQGLQRKFDLVMNFGTTEHILNQLNCFKVIHDATKVGGHIYHSLPAVGYVDHGYITYTGRCFFDVAGYNDYELVACWFDGPHGANNIFDSLRSYSGSFPALMKALEQFDQNGALRDLVIPDIGINVVYRKTRDKPFWGALESSTSVGVIPGGVTAAYEGSGASLATGIPPATNAQRMKLLIRRIAGALQGHPSLYRFARRAYRMVARR